MPYTQNSKDLPSYVMKLSDANKSRWIEIFNAAYEKYGEEKALLLANTWLKRNIKKESVVAKSTASVEHLVFTVDTSSELIKRADDGEDYIDFILTDDKPDDEGVVYPPELLKKWADQINSGQLLLGDFDHEKFNVLVKQGLRPNDVMQRLKTKPGIAKMIKAVIDKGKLWVRTVIDKRYKKLIKEKAKGVSLEASLIRDDTTNEIIDGVLGGFTFAINSNPHNERAMIA